MVCSLLQMQADVVYLLGRGDAPILSSLVWREKERFSASTW